MPFDVRRVTAGQEKNKAIYGASIVYICIAVIIYAKMTSNIQCWRVIAHCNKPKITVNRLRRADAANKICLSMISRWKNYGTKFIFQNNYLICDFF